MTSLSPRTINLTKHGATLYGIQLGLNLMFMPLFFSWKRPVAATVDIFALTGVAGYMTYLWSQVDEVAGYFLAPYVGWLGFASYITVSSSMTTNWSSAQLLFRSVVAISTTGTFMIKNDPYLQPRRIAVPSTPTKRISEMHSIQSREIRFILHGDKSFRANFPPDSGGFADSIAYWVIDLNFF